MQAQSKSNAASALLDQNRLRLKAHDGGLEYTRSDKGWSALHDHRVPQANPGKAPLQFTWGPGRLQNEQNEPVSDEQCAHEVGLLPGVRPLARRRVCSLHIKMHSSMAHRVKHCFSAARPPPVPRCDQTFQILQTLYPRAISCSTQKQGSAG